MLNSARVYSSRSAQVVVSWYGTEILRSTGIRGTVIRGNAERTDLYTPDWYDSFRNAAPYSTNRAQWRKGHLIASSFQGPREFYNFVPQYFAANNGAWQTCENRLRDAFREAAMRPCPCAYLEITPEYTTDEVVPSSIRFKVRGEGGLRLSFDVPVLNTVTAPPVPPECM